MQKLIVSSLATLAAMAALAAAPALAQPETKTTLVTIDGASADALQLHHDFDAAWVIDSQTILYRDVSRDHYLVTLKEACKQVEVRGRDFNFHPSWSSRLLASNAYEIRPAAGKRCNVARVEQLDGARASQLQEAAQRRVW
ncbi:MAG TPA: hypothetical protein VGO52_25750 [Hyphomonadaceae bacterium]|jgi:hypothetical protein|nr:hypothetical protein [Hyphomonadaceae bacterium]